MSADDRKKACETYVEQTKLLVTLASAFFLAPAAFFAIFAKREKLGLTAGAIKWFIVPECLFVSSVLLGYFTLGSIVGSQEDGSYDVYRPATLWLSRAQVALYVAGLATFVKLVLVGLSSLNG